MSFYNRYYVFIQFIREEQGVTQASFGSRVELTRVQSFASPTLMALPKFNYPVCSTAYLKVEGKIEFMPFWRALILAV